MACTLAPLSLLPCGVRPLCVLCVRAGMLRLVCTDFQRACSRRMGSVLSRKFPAPVLVQVSQRLIATKPAASLAVAVLAASVSARCADSEEDEIDRTMRELLAPAMPAADGSSPAYAEEGGVDPLGEEDEDEDDEDEEDGEDEDVEEPASLEVGSACNHDLLGDGVILAIGATGCVVDGLLGPDEDFSTLNLGTDQVLFQFLKREIYGRNGRSWRTVDKKRPVFAVNVKPLALDASPAQGGGTTAFESMAAASLETDAFTAGLTAPELAAHERKRKILLMTTANKRGARGRNKAMRKTPEPKLEASVRIKEFPHHSLQEDPSGPTGLFCACCKKDISKRLVAIKAHVNGAEHNKKLILYEEARQTDKSLADIITDFFETNPDVAMGTVNTDTQVFRWRVVESMMFAGIPLQKIDLLRHLFEREGHPLSDSTHLRRLFIPQIEEREIKRVVRDVIDQHFAFIFDGTTRLGEAVNMVTRSITDDFTIQMRLVAFKTTKVHMSGDELFRLIVTTLQRVLGLNLDHLVAFARDSCATNQDAVNRMMPLTVNALNMLCFPHTLHNTGKHIKLIVLEEFMTPWLQLVPQPGAARLRWSAILGKAVSGYSKVRWWSRWEIMQELALNFGSLLQFVTDLDRDNIGDATTKKMLTILTNQSKELELELAAVMSCEQLCKATYRMEGDRLELLLVHRTVEELRQFGKSLGKDASNLPSVTALLRNGPITLGTETLEWFPPPHSRWYHGQVTRLPITTGAMRYRTDTYKVTYVEDGTTIEQAEQELRNNMNVLNMPEWHAAVNIVQGAYDYLEQRITDDCQVPYHCSGPYEVCRVSQVFDPSFAINNLTASFVDELCAAIPAISDCAIALKAEVNSYKVAAATAPTLDHNDVKAFSEKVLEFWRAHGTKMPAWRKAARIVFAIPPNSAASERVFSLLEDMFGKEQDSSLSDLIQAALMLRYNKRNVG